MSEFGRVESMSKDPGTTVEREPQAEPTIQRKLLVGSANDPLEREADRVAARVVASISAARSSVLHEPGSDQDPRVQSSGRDAPAEPAVHTIQRISRASRVPVAALSSSPSRIRPKSAGVVGRAGGEVDGETESRIARASGRGTPIDDGVRGPMESAFGADFSRVRIHIGATADELTQQLQARAFTTGDDIFFRSGEYRPDSSGGQELLAHELTHVVQQGMAGGTDVQRSLGLEFQTGWHLFHEMPGKVAGDPPVEVAYPKETSILGDRTGVTGWSMETDGKDIEFVVEPPFDESPAGLIRLGHVMASLRALTDQLDALRNQPRLTRATHPQFFAPGWWDPDGAVIKPNGAVLAAQPQATAGVRLDRMEELFREMQREGDESDLSASQGTTYFANRAGAAAGAAANAPPVNGIPASDELKGFITLATQYITQGDQDGRRAYAKDIAYAMARTNFAHMFSLLPEEAYFAANPHQFVDVVLTTAGFANTGADLLIKQRIADGQDTQAMTDAEQQNLPRLPLTRGQWLHDISQGTDRLTQAATINTMPYTDVKGGNRVRAMGLLGTNTDDVGGNGSAGIIVELRQMKRAIPATEWFRVARGLMRFLIDLNDHTSTKVAAGQLQYQRRG